MLLLVWVAAVSWSAVGPDFASSAREAGLARARREYKARHDPLAGWDHPDRARVERVCAQADAGAEAVGVPNERHVCLQRGRALSKELGEYTADKFSRRDVDAMFDLANRAPDKTFFAWVRIEKGRAVDYRGVGHHLDNNAVHGIMTVLHHTAFVAFSQKLGAFSQDQTFEYLALMYDRCWGSPFLANQVSMSDAFRYMPVLGYSREETCRNHIVVPTVQWVNVYSPPLSVPYADLHDTAVFRGRWFTDTRALMAIAAAGNLLHDVDAKLECSAQDMGLRCKSTVAMLKRSHALPDTLHEAHVCDVSKLCFATPSEQRTHKFLLALDGIGGTDRIEKYFRESGVVIQVASLFEWYYSGDAIPWVHYVRLDPKPAEIVPQLNDALAWLRAHPADGGDIAHTSRRYAERHVGDRAAARYFQLFAALYAPRWDDSYAGEPLRPIDSGKHLLPQARKRGRREVGGPFTCRDMQRHYDGYIHHHPPLQRWLDSACGPHAHNIRHLNKGWATFDNVGNEYGLLPVRTLRARPVRKSVERVSYVSDSVGSNGSLGADCNTPSSMCVRALFTGLCVTSAAVVNSDRGFPVLVVITVLLIVTDMHIRENAW